MFGVFVELFYSWVFGCLWNEDKEFGIFFWNECCVFIDGLWLFLGGIVEEIWFFFGVYGGGGWYIGGVWLIGFFWIVVCFWNNIKYF